MSNYRERDHERPYQNRDYDHRQPPLQQPNYPQQQQQQLQQQQLPRQDWDQPYGGGGPVEGNWDDRRLPPASYRGGQEHRGRGGGVMGGGGRGGRGGERWDAAGERDFKMPRYDEPVYYEEDRRRWDDVPPRRDGYSPPRHNDRPSYPVYDDYREPAPYRGASAPSYPVVPDPYEQPRHPYSNNPPADRAYPPEPRGAATAPYQQHHHQQHQQPPPQQVSAHVPNNVPAPAASQHRPAPVRPDPPSASVVLLGLPPHVDDRLLRIFLEDLGASIDSTTVILDRATGLSKRYGFAKFGSVEHARAFVEPNFPSVEWRERGVRGTALDDGTRIKINYSQKTGGWREDQGAGARLGEDQRKAAGDHDSPAFYVNDGTRDVGSTPTQILLLRGLDPLTSEEDIVAVLGNMSGRAGIEVREGRGVKKVFITKDRASRSSWGYAFVQFADVRLATEVLASAFNPQQYPTGFRIRNSVVAFSFSHENSFVPIYARSEWSFKGEGGQQLAYWDDKAFVTPWIPASVAAAIAQAKAAILNQPKVDAAEADMEAFFSSIEAEVPSSTTATAALVAEPAPLAMAPGSTPISFQLKPTATPSAVAAAGVAPAPGTDAEERLKQLIKSRKGKDGSGPGDLSTPSAIQAEKKKPATGDLIVSRKAAKDISKWNVKQQELNPGLTAVPAVVAPSVPVPSKIISALEPPTTTTITPTITTTAISPPDFDYGDPVTMICLLCQRQFKTTEDLAKHNRLSALHKTNLTNPTTVSDAIQRKAAKINATSSSNTVAAGSSPPKYVDRAAARREALGQPEHPSQDRKRKLGADPSLITTTMAPSVPDQVNKSGIDPLSNVGAKMLEKMGWSKGGGLGTDSNGRIEPIQAAQFKKGAGLGATKGVAVGEYAVGPSGYKEALRDKARQRLEEDMS